MLDRFYRDRRRAQAGTTLVELLVSLMIIGIALVLVVGTLSTGLLNASLVNRNTAVQAIVQYEMDAINASVYDSSPSAYSECFTRSDATTAPSVQAFRADCPDSSFTLRADVAVGAGPTASSQTWTITVVDWPGRSQIGKPLQLIKVNR